MKSKMELFEAIFMSFEAANVIVAGATVDVTARTVGWNNNLDERYIAAGIELNRRFVKLKEWADSKCSKATMNSYETHWSGNINANFELLLPIYLSLFALPM